MAEGSYTPQEISTALTTGEWEIIAAVIILWTLEELGVPDPVSEFFSLFDGRPTLEATLDEARIFGTYASPVLKLLSMGAARCLNAGVPLSSPDAGALFGPFFSAAVNLEDIVRWQSHAGQIPALDAQTLSVAMTEAGNPGIVGTQTLQGIETAWTLFNGQPHSGDTAWHLFSDMANQTGGFPQAMLEKNVAAQWLQRHPYNPQPSPTPPPSPTPQPPPPPPPGPPFIHILAPADGSQVSNSIALVAQTGGGDFPDGVVRWLVDNVMLRDGNPSFWQTKNSSNGNHILTAQWVGVRGDIHASSNHFVTVFNQTGPIPPPPPGQPVPPTMLVDLPNGATVSGVRPITVDVTGGPHPQAVLLFAVDGQLIETEPAPTTVGTIPTSVHLSWDTRQSSNGLHNLTYTWRHAVSGTILARTLSATVANQTGPSPTPPPGGGTNTITINFYGGEEVADLQPLQAHVTGGPHPQARLIWEMGARQVADIAAPTEDATTTRVYTTQFDFNSLPQGQVQITARWQHQDGSLIILTGARVVNTGGSQPHPTPPPPTPTPPPGGGGGPPPGPLPWAQWFRVCAETPNCDNMSDDYLALTQMLANIAALIWEIVQGQGKEDPCCKQIVTGILSINKTLLSLTQSIENKPEVKLLLPSMTDIAKSLDKIVLGIHGIGVDFTVLDKAFATINLTLKEIEKKICCPDLKPLEKILQQWRDDDQVPPSWTKLLVDLEMLPPELTGLMQGTNWLQAIATAAHMAGSAFGWTVREVDEGAGWLIKHIGKPVAHFMHLIVNEFMMGFDPHHHLSAPSLAKIAQGIGNFIDEIFRGVFGGALGEVMTLYERDIEHIDTSNLEGVELEIKTLIGRCVEFGLLAHCLAFIAEWPLFNKFYGIDEIAKLTDEFAGFKEVIIQAHRPFLTAALGRPATYAFNRKFATALPPIGGAMSWWARGLMSDADAKHLLQSNGYKDSWDPIFFRAAYHPIQARALANLLQDQPIDLNQLRAVLRDNGFRPEDVNFLVTAFDYASTKNVRNSYINQAITAYEHGVMPDNELTDILNSVGWSQTAHKFVIDRAALARRVTLATKVEAAMVPLVASGQITAEEGRQQLEAAGVQPWMANLEIELADTKAKVLAVKLEAIKERREELERQRNLTRAAVAEYRQGRINVPELTLALDAIGLDPIVTASIVAVEEATQHGKLKLTFGQLLLPSDSEVLKERVATIEQQVKDQLISLAVGKQQLHALKLPAPEVDALIARWAATLKKTPGASVLIDPLTGNLETNAVA